MNALKIFDEKATILPFITKNKKLLDILLAIYCCLVMPIVSAIIATRGEERAIYKSLSYLAYTEGHMAIVYIWGLCFFVGYFFALTLILSFGKYSKIWKIILFSLAAISTIVMIVGISVPWLHVEGDLAPKYDRLRKIHNNVSMIGFILVFVTTFVLFVTTFFRNINQGIFSICSIGYLLVTALVSMFESNIVPGPCKISSIAQIYIFSSILFLMFIQYIFMNTIQYNKTRAVKNAMNPKSWTK